MERVEIVIIRNGERQSAEFLCDTKNVTITFVMLDGYTKSYSGSDFYNCFGDVRQEHQDISFLCKGAMINVHPSSMSSQMTQGVKAYELTFGKCATRDDIVNIFDYEEKNLTNDPEVQKKFFVRWIESDIIES